MLCAFVGGLFTILLWLSLFTSFFLGDGYHTSQVWCSDQCMGVVPSSFQLAYSNIKNTRYHWNRKNSMTVPVQRNIVHNKSQVCQVWARISPSIFHMFTIWTYMYIYIYILCIYIHIYIYTHQSSGLQHNSHWLTPQFSTWSLPTGYPLISSFWPASRVTRGSGLRTL